MLDQPGFMTKYIPKSEDAVRVELAGLGAKIGEVLK